MEERELTGIVTRFVNEQLEREEVTKTLLQQGKYNLESALPGTPYRIEVEYLGDETEWEADVDITTNDINEALRTRIASLALFGKENFSPAVEREFDYSNDHYIYTIYFQELEKSCTVAFEKAIQHYKESSIEALKAYIDEVHNNWNVCDGDPYDYYFQMKENLAELYNDAVTHDSYGTEEEKFVNMLQRRIEAFLIGYERASK